MEVKSRFLEAARAIQDKVAGPKASQSEKGRALADFIGRQNVEAVRNSETKIVDGRRKVAYRDDAPTFELGKECSVRELWKATTGLDNVPAHPREFHEAVNSGGFDKAVSRAIAPQTLRAYEEQPRIWDRISSTVQQDVETETVVGFDSNIEPSLVLEGGAYPQATMSERYVTGQVYKYGQMLELTKELISRDQTGRIAGMARDIGIAGARFKEKWVVYAATDQFAGTAKIQNPKLQYVYFPSGTGEALYAAGNSNVKTSNALADETDIANSRAIHEAFTDANGFPIDSQIRQILVPQALADTLTKILRSTTAPSASNNGVFNVYGPGGSYPGIEPLTSVYMADTTTWFTGDFARQLVIGQEFAPMVEVDRDSGWMNDVTLKLKFSESFSLYHSDQRYVVKNSA
jgi:hypothetical protein